VARFADLDVTQLGLELFDTEFELINLPAGKRKMLDWRLDAERREGRREGGG
jgi:hypothetical protein